MAIIRYVKRIVAIPSSDKEVKKSLRKEIENEKILTEREWLLSKL